MAVAIFAMFVLGLWMGNLNYYSPYYNSAPDLHRSVGIILLIALVIRFVWRLINPKPDGSELLPIERKASHVAHWGFYPLLFALMVSGYLISTDGRSTCSVCSACPPSSNRKGSRTRRASSTRFWPTSLWPLPCFTVEAR